MARKGPIPRDLAERFWEKVEKGPEDDGCWLWRAGLSGDGAGEIRTGASEVRSAHRTAWFLTHGSWPDGVLWRCTRNPRCVRPGHCRLEVPPEVQRRRESWNRWVPRREPSRLEKIRALMARRK